MAGAKKSWASSGGEWVIKVLMEQHHLVVVAALGTEWDQIQFA